MKEISVVEPLFFSEFKCAGSACLDHCCKGWDIYLDKPTVNRYLKSGDITVRQLAEENIIKTKKSFDNWGTMKLSTSGNCAFLDENSLCSIHKKMGEKALSPTCSSYPRSQKKTKYEIRNSLTLSCPEAVRGLLASPEAMLLNENKTLRIAALNAPEVDQASRFINLMCSNLLLASGANIEQGLYGIAMLFLFAEKAGDSADKYTRLEEYFFSVLNLIEQGEMAANIDSIKPDYQLQWALLLRLQAYLGSHKAIRGSGTLIHYVNKLIYIQSDLAEGNDVTVSMKRLAAVWQDKLKPWLAERPHIMGNYLQYRMYHDGFPSHSGQSALANLYLLTAEWFLLRSLLSASLELVGTISENDVINIIYSYHSVTKHDQISDKAFMHEIEKSKVNDDLSLLHLLR